MIRLVTLTGPSGTGKTTIMKRLLLSESPRFQMIQSTTTREKRPSDLSGEFEYCTLGEFEKAQKDNEFLWTAEVTGKRYGTRRSRVDEVFAQNRFVGMMILVPEVVPLLRAYATTEGVDDRLKCFYVKSLPDGVLRDRMKKRGDSDEAISARLLLCRDWDTKARIMNCFDAFVSNENEQDHGAKISTSIIDKIN